MKYSILIFFLSLSSFWAIGQECYTQIQLKVINKSGKVDPDAIFVASELNDWSPANPNFKFSNDSIPSLTIHGTCNTHAQYKICLGPSWEYVEKDSNGHDLSNRTLTFNNSIEQLTVYHWESRANKSTAISNVQLLAAKDGTDQWINERPIWICLPTDYFNSNERYPVLYMHDGQNLFDEKLAFSGEWKVDESLLELEKEGLKLIVVAIANGGKNRIEEYSFWPNEKYGGGAGVKYATFIAQKLKPYIDKEYRTLHEPANTGIAGSSLGALISVSTYLTFSDSFQNVGLLSPSFWFNPELFPELEQQDPLPAKIYIAAGENESETMVKYIKEFEGLVEQKGPEFELKIAIDREGEHNERWWSTQFPDMIRFLFGEGN